VVLRTLLPILLLPVAITLMLLAAGLIFRRRALVWSGFVLLWIASTPMVSGRLVRIMEGGAQRLRPTDVSDANSIVVLSGGRVTAPGSARMSEWVDANRFYGGIELFKAGKAPKLVFTGGLSPLDPTAEPEGTILRGYAKDLGIPDSSILVTGRVTNTAEEAQAVAKLLSGRNSRPGASILPVRRERLSVLLVTSAIHMPRARSAFEREGLTVIPFPVDFQGSSGKRITILSLLPNAASLDGTERSLREFYGRVFYAARY